MRRRGPALIITSCNYLGINFPNFAPSGDKFQTNAAARAWRAQAESWSAPQLHPRVWAHREHTGSGHRVRALAATLPRRICAISFFDKTHFVQVSSLLSPSFKVVCGFLYEMIQMYVYILAGQTGCWMCQTVFIAWSRVEFLKIIMPHN